jgi:hypothetical protein
VRDDQHWRGVELPPDYDPRPFIAAQEWRFAKTMPWHPHEYVMIHKATDAFEHVRFLVWIRLTGKIEVYKGSEYPYVEIDGYRYWALRPEYTIINRRTAPPRMTLTRRCPSRRSRSQSHRRSTPISRR